MKYIISLKWTHKDDAFITLWGPNNNGYQWDKKKAGLYDIKGHKDYYNNGDSTFAVDEKKLDPLFVKSELFGNKVVILPNVPKVRKTLGILKTRFINKYPSECPNINIFKP